MLSLSPATRVFLALAPIDGRNHSVRPIIPSRVTDEAYCRPSLVTFLVSDSE
jgi:hypothetical protein